MKYLNKSELHKMQMEDLENLKMAMLSRVNGENHVMRRVLFEVLGVIDWKKWEKRRCEIA